MKFIFSLLITCLLAVTHSLYASPIKENEATDQLSGLTKKYAGLPFRLKSGEGIATKLSFHPPIEITIVAKTNSTNIRIGYAAQQVVFNWEVNPLQLRVDGGPADGQHKMGAGKIPINTYVTIRWLVTPSGQKIYGRFEKLQSVGEQLIGMGSA